MTCILGYCDGKNVWMGGDSAIMSGWNRVISPHQKIFKLGNILVGLSGYIRDQQVIQYNLHPPIHPEEMSDMQYLVSLFIPELQKLMKHHDIDLDHEDSGSRLLIGYKGYIYTLASDLGICRYLGIMAVGSGEELARGAMTALLNYEKSIEFVIINSLTIVGEIDASVSAPYYIHKLGEVDDPSEEGNKS